MGNELAADQCVTAMLNAITQANEIIGLSDTAQACTVFPTTIPVDGPEQKVAASAKEHVEAFASSNPHLQLGGKLSLLFV